MACFEVMEVSTKGCRVNGSLMHGLEAHAATRAINEIGNHKSLPAKRTKCRHHQRARRQCPCHGLPAHELRSQFLSGDRITPIRQDQAPWRGERASARFILERLVNLTDYLGARSSRFANTCLSVQTGGTPVFPSGPAKMACFEVMEVSAKGCRVNGSLIHGLEAHGTVMARRVGWRCLHKKLSAGGVRPDRTRLPTRASSAKSCCAQV